MSDSRSVVRCWLAAFLLAGIVLSAARQRYAELNTASSAMAVSSVIGHTPLLRTSSPPVPLATIGARNRSKVRKEKPLCDVASSFDYENGHWRACLPHEDRCVYDRSRKGKPVPWRRCWRTEELDTRFCDQHFAPQSFEPKRCRLLPFRSHDFMRLMRHRSLVFVGDSLSKQHYLNLCCHLETSRLLTGKRFLGFHGLNMTQYQEFFLFNWTAGASALMHDVANSDRESLLQRHFGEPKSFHQFLKSSDILVVNVGAWFTPPGLRHLFQLPSDADLNSFFTEPLINRLFETTVEALLRFLRDSGQREPGNIVIFREITPAQATCIPGLRTKEFHWNTFAWRNQRVRELFAEYSLPLSFVMSTKPLASRPECMFGVFARASGDCLHFCHLDAFTSLDVMSNILFTFLHQLAPPAT